MLVFQFGVKDFYDLRKCICRSCSFNWCVLW